MVPLPVDKELLKQLTDMGFPDVRARKAIHHGVHLDGAVAWLGEHQEDAGLTLPMLPNAYRNSSSSSSSSSNNDDDNNNDDDDNNNNNNNNNNNCQEYPRNYRASSHLIHFYLALFA